MEKILDWRKGIENDHSASLTIKKRQEDTKKDELNNLLTEYEKLKANIMALKAPNELAQIQLYKDQLSDRIIEEKHYLNDLHDELEIIKNDLIVARKDKLAIEKLKEKDYEKHKEKVKKQEQSFLDEIATIRHTRKDG